MEGKSHDVFGIDRHLKHSDCSNTRGYFGERIVPFFFRRPNVPSVVH